MPQCEAGISYAAKDVFTTVKDANSPRSLLRDVFCRNCSALVGLGMMSREAAWRNVLVQAKEVIRIVVCFDLDHALPSFAIGLGDSILFVTAHEVYIDAGLHRRPQLGKNASDP